MVAELCQNGVCMAYEIYFLFLFFPFKCKSKPFIKETPVWLLYIPHTQILCCRLMPWERYE